MIVFLRLLTWLIVPLWALWVGWSIFDETFEWWMIPIVSLAFVTGRLAARIQRKREEKYTQELVQRYQREQQRRRGGL